MSKPLRCGIKRDLHQALSLTGRFAKNHILVSIAVPVIAYALGVVASVTLIGNSASWNDSVAVVTSAVACLLVTICVFVFNLWNVPRWAYRDLLVEYNDVCSELDLLKAPPSLTSEAKEILSLARAASNVIVVARCSGAPKHVQVGSKSFCSDDDPDVANRYLIAFQTEIESRGLVRESKDGLYELHGDGLRIAMELPRPANPPPRLTGVPLGLSARAEDVLLRAYQSDRSISVKKPEVVPAKGPVASRILVVAGKPLFKVGDVTTADQYEEACRELERLGLATTNGESGWQLTPDGVVAGKQIAAQRNQ